MASSIPDASFLEDLSDNFLQCPVHLDRFDKPKMLPCLHSVCLSCLNLWQKQMGASNEVTCPQCRQVCPVPAEGVQGLPDNFLINSLLDYVDQHDESGDGKKCDICGSESPTSEVIRCVDCSMFLCSACTASHKKIPSTAGHQLIPMAEFDSLSVADRLNLSSPMCSKHPTARLEFFCMKCKTPVCTQCTVVAHKVPAHKIQELPEAYAKLKKQLESELKGSQKKHSKIQQAIADTTTNLNELEIQRDEAYEAAQEQADKIIDLVSQYLAEIEENIEQEYLDQKTLMDTHLEDLLQVDEDFKHTQEFGDRIIQFGNQVTLTSVGPDIIRKVGNLRSASQKLAMIKAKANLKLQINEDFESEMSCDSIGYISKQVGGGVPSEESQDEEADEATPSTPTEVVPDVPATGGDASAANTVIKRTYKGRSYPGNALDLSVLVRDAYGNPTNIEDITAFSCQMKMPVVSEDFQEALDKLGQSPATSSVEKTEDGSVVIRFVPRVPGHFTLFVTLDGKPVKSYPYSVQVFPDKRRESSTDQESENVVEVKEMISLMSIGTTRSSDRPRGDAGRRGLGGYRGRGSSPAGSDRGGYSSRGRGGENRGGRRGEHRGGRGGHRGGSGSGKGGGRSGEGYTSDRSDNTRDMDYGRDKGGSRGGRGGQSGGSRGGQSGGSRGGQSGGSRGGRGGKSNRGGKVGGGK